MHISQISINRPVTTAMFFLAVILKGAELQRPLAVILITGLVISTVVSLIAVSVFYTFCAGKK